MSMNDFIIEFENLNHKTDSHNMKLPNKVLNFKLQKIKHKCVKH